MGGSNEVESAAALGGDGVNFVVARHGLALAGSLEVEPAVAERDFGERHRDGDVQVALRPRGDGCRNDGEADLPRAPLEGSLQELHVVVAADDPGLRCDRSLTHVRPFKNAE